MQQITKSTLEKFQCNVTTELPTSITAILNLANEPSFSYVITIWNDFVDYSATECNYFILDFSSLTLRLRCFLPYSAVPVWKK